MPARLAEALRRSAGTVHWKGAPVRIFVEGLAIVVVAGILLSLWLIL
jgi:hypothetical protein